MNRSVLTQKVNFSASVGLIVSFGFLMVITIVQAYDQHAALVQYIKSPILPDYERY